MSGPPVFHIKAGASRSVPCPRTQQANLPACSPIKCYQLAFEFATNNNLPVTESWTDNKPERKECLSGFMKQHDFSLRTAEATSLDQATAFYRNTVVGFFDHLGSIMERFQIQSH